MAVVLDKSGAAIPGAKVSISNNGQALQRSAETNNAGEYRFLALPPGNYTLTVEKPEFHKYDANWIWRSNYPARPPINHGGRSSLEKIDVAAEAETLNTTDASLGNAFSETQVKELPL